MENNELDLTLQDNLDGDTEGEDGSNEQDDGSDENQNSSKNTSNFKKMSKAYKGALAKIKELEAKVGQGQVTNEDTRIFFLENPDLAPYKQAILDLKANPKYKTLDMSDLVELAKVKTQLPSEDKEDFDITTKVKTGSKKLEDLSEEEALKLDNKTYFEWRNLKQPKKPGADIWGN